MATFPKNHNTLYFDALIRTQKAESLLSLIHATYHAKKAARNGGDVKADIAKRLQHSYGLFKDNIKGYDNGFGSYSGSEDQFESQYTLGHEMAIWINSSLDLNPLATQVAQNLITIRDYLDIVLLNYVQPISGVCVHPLHAILTYMQKHSVTKISKEEMITAIPATVAAESINALFHILLSTNYFNTNADKELCYIGKLSIADLIDCCNLTYVGAEGYSRALEELNETAYNAYIIKDNRCQSVTEDDEIVVQIAEEDIFSGFEPWLTSKDNPDYTGVEKYSYYIRSLPLLLTFMKEHDLIENDNLNDLDVDKFNSIIEIYRDSAEAKNYDFRYLNHNAGIAALRKYVKYIKFLISRREVSCDLPIAKAGGVNKIFYGVPGCGKSYHIQHDILDAEKYDDNNVVRTTFYQDYSNTDFVGQILPKITKDEDGKDIVEYIFNPGPFTLALIQAISNPTKKVALVVEEINRGNAPAIFGDIFQLLDRNEDGISEYGIKNVSLLDYLNAYRFDVDGQNKRYFFSEIRIPGNMNIYATMNTSDQNVYTLDTAFTRRWEKERISNDLTGNAIERLLVPGMEQRTWGQFVKAINDQISEKLDDLQVNEDKQVGRFFVKKTDLFEPNNTLSEADKKKKAMAFAHKVLEYLWDDVTKLDHSVIFKPGYKTFAKVVEDYLEHGADVFNSNLFKD